jgi:hypothetical protein
MMNLKYMRFFEMTDQPYWQVRKLDLWQRDREENISASLCKGRSRELSQLSVPGRFPSRRRENNLMRTHQSRGD